VERFSTGWISISKTEPFHSFDYHHDIMRVRWVKPSHLTHTPTHLLSFSHTSNMVMKLNVDQGNTLMEKKSIFDFSVHHSLDTDDGCQKEEFFKSRIKT
jgi:alanyl-tRNA synthetase